MLLEWQPKPPFLQSVHFCEIKTKMNHETAGYEALSMKKFSSPGLIGGGAVSDQDRLVSYDTAVHVFVNEDPPILRAFYIQLVEVGPQLLHINLHRSNLQCLR